MLTLQLLKAEVSRENVEVIYSSAGVGGDINRSPYSDISLAAWQPISLSWTGVA